MNVVTIVVSDMASLRKHPRSPFWFACFTLADGRRTQRSTGTSDKRKALAIALKYDDAARESAAGRFTESRARKVISDIYALTNTERLPGSKTRAFFQAWLKRKEIESDPHTHQRYSGIVKHFYQYLGPKQELDLVQITPSDVAGFRDELATRLASATANLMVKVLRTAFAQARRDGLIDTNPAERVTMLKRQKNDNKRRPFSMAELQSVLNVADDEWKGMIYFGLYSGQRLGDIAEIIWRNVYLEDGELRFDTEKVGRRQITPLAPPLVKHIVSLTAGDPNEPLFPRAYKIIREQGRSGNLSNLFYKILAKAGLVQKKTHKATGKGRSAKRDQNELSFHSLRHTLTSLLKSSGVSDSVTMEFVGHASKCVSDIYTHIPIEILKEAAKKLPDIVKSKLNLD
jgi:integrase